MGKQERRMRRRAKGAGGVGAFLTAIEGGAAKGIDLSKLLATDIGIIELDATENTLTVRMSLPVGKGDGFAEYEEMYDFDEERAPVYLRNAARDLSRAVVRAIRERVFTSGDLPCATCTARCCGKEFTQVRVTALDVERLSKAGVDIEEHINLYDDGEDFSGHVGEIVLEDSGEDEDEPQCPFLKAWGCGIYLDRPLICREYSPWTCDLHELDADKVDGSITFGVATEDTDGDEKDDEGDEADEEADTQAEAEADEEAEEGEGSDPSSA